MTPLEFLGEHRDRAGYFHARFAKPNDFAYQPGQYAAMHLEKESKARYLAFASHPAEGELLFISRHGCAGQKAMLSKPMGEGFGCDYSNPKPILFISHGTGISALRPAILERQRVKAPTDTLLYGIAGREHEPELDILRADFPLRQLRAYSRTEARQRVQHVLPTVDTDAFGAILLVGGKEMMAEVRAILASKEYPAEQIFTNF